MITRLGIQNYKSISQVDIDLDGLTVLIGRSGTGKTNIVDAVRFWRQYIATRQWRVPNEHWHAILSAGSDEKTMGINFTFTVPGTPGTFFYGLTFKVPSANSSHPQLHTESLTFDGKQVFLQQEHKWLMPPPVMQPPSPGQIGLGRIYGLPEATTAYLALTQGIGCYDFGADVLRSPPSGNRKEVRGLEDRAENFLSVFAGISGALSATKFKEVVSAMQILHPTVATFDLEATNEDRIYVSHRTAAGKALTLELSQQSEGFRRFLAHMLALYQIPSKPVLFFEEAEKGIYPGALAVLADHFKAVTTQGDSQVILTTHSPQLLDHFSPESIRVVEMNDYRTKVGPLVAEQADSLRQHLLSAGELLTADPARVAEPV